MQAKNKECVVCGRNDQPWFSKKRCRQCTITQSSPFKNSGKKITPQTEKNKQKRKEERACFEEFFPAMIQKITEEKIRCQNCGCQIYSPSSLNVAHILSKSSNKEMQCEELNILFLCWDCHTEFDSSLSARFLMPVFSLAAEKYNSFKHLVIKQTSETRQLENYLDGR